MLRKGDHEAEAETPREDGTGSNSDLYKSTTALERQNLTGIHETGTGVSDPKLIRKNSVTKPKAFSLMSTADKVPLHHRYFPFLYWVPKYNWREYLGNDVIAGVTLAVMVVPQSMAYALIASLSPVQGLYSATFALLAYPFFGTSGQAHVGPVAILSLMTHSAIAPHVRLNEDDPGYVDEYAALGALLAFEVGITQMLMGALRGGMLAHLLSHPVIVGFTAAAGCLIGMSQVKYCLKIEVEGEEFFFMLIDACKHVKHTHWPSLVLSICTIFVLNIMRVWKKRPAWKWSQYIKFVPIQLFAVLWGTFISWGIGHSSGFDIVGVIEKGLPNPVNFFNHISADAFLEMLPTALLISIVAFVETYAVANKMAEKRGYRVDPSQELIALGMSNLVVCWFRGFSVAGSLSRTAVAEAAGSVTPIYQLVSGVFLLITVAFLVTLFKWLPKCILGSIVMVAVLNLFDMKELKHLYDIRRRDFFVAMITFVMTLIIGIEYGVASGVFASVLAFVQQASKPHYAILGRIPNTSIYRGVKSWPQAKPENNILIIRWDANLFFGNIIIFKNRIKKQISRFLHTFLSGGTRAISEEVAEVSQLNDDVETLTEQLYELRRRKSQLDRRWMLLLCMSGVNDIDATAIEHLKVFLEDLTAIPNMEIAFASVKEPVHDVLSRSGIIEVIGEDNIFDRVRAGVKAFQNRRRSQMSQISIEPLVPLAPPKNAANNSTDGGDDGSDDDSDIDDENKSPPPALHESHSLLEMQPNGTPIITHINTDDATLIGGDMQQQHVTEVIETDSTLLSPDQETLPPDCKTPLD